MERSPHDDPVFSSSRREAIIVLCVFAACCIYSLTYCFSTGYNVSNGPVPTTWGIPDWVLYGVFLPWMLCNVFAFWFCFFFIEDGDLGTTPDEDSTSDSAGEA